MPLSSDFTYLLTHFSTAEVAALRPFYDRLPLDPYIQGVFRRRRFSRFLGPASRLRRLEHLYFLQSKNVNHLAGGIRRHFQELEDELLTQPAFQAMVTTFIEGMGIDPEVREFGVHQIRIACSPEFAGSPAPEGIHQDGFDYIGMFCVERHQITGATTRIYPAKDQPPLFSRDLQAGEAVLANDRKVFHFADQVRPSGDHPGHWDLLVITS